MNQTNFDKTKYGIWVDFRFIRNVLKLWFIVIFCLSVTVASCAYIGSDLLLHDTYTANATVAVVSKVNSTSALNQSNTGRAITRNLAMWNSNALLKCIRDENPGIPIQGTLNATAIKDSNLIRLTATAHSAESAYFLLCSAIRNYHSIDSNFDTNYTGVMLTRVTSDSISVTKKQPVLFAMLGFLGTVFGGILLIVLWSLFTDVLHNEEQAKQLLDIPVYESLRSVNKKRLKILAVRITEPNIDAGYIEDIDRLTARVQQHMRQHKQKIIMVTSIQENEGKSTVSSNLALNLSRHGSRTLLLDMDFRCPALYRFFDREIVEDGSLSLALEEKETLISTVDYCKDFFNVNVIWQYKPVRDADRFLEKNEVYDKVRALVDHFDYIVLDTPPLGPVRDTEVIAKIADCSLLVIREDSIRAAVANDVIDQLDESGASCMGAVLNNCHSLSKVKKSRFDRYYTYKNQMK